jgi:membrane fusion protein (multidrug efflux system)
MRIKKRWTLAAVAAIGLAIAVAVAVPRLRAAAPDKKNKEPVPLEFTARDLVRLVPHTLVTDLNAPGSVQAVSQATIRAKLSAEVKRVLVREGERVAAGQVVAEFDTASLRAQAAERTAALESARAQLAQSERTRQSSAQLVKQNFVSQNAFDSADAGYRAQRAAVDAAAAQLAQTQLLLNDAVVRAPIAGFVAKRHVQPGEKVAFDTPLFAIVDLARLEVQTQVPVSDVAQVTSGARAEVDVEGLPGRVFVGRVDRINPSTEPGTRSIHVYVALDNAEAVLKSGMFARVRLRVGTADAVPALPVAAVQVDAGQSFVWAIADGKLARRPIETGRRDERAQLVEVRSGLDRSAAVLASKFDNLRDGRAALVLDAAATGARIADREDGVPVKTTSTN